MAAWKACMTKALAPFGVPKINFDHTKGLVDLDIMGDKVMFVILEIDVAKDKAKVSCGNDHRCEMVVARNKEDADDPITSALVNCRERIRLSMVVTEEQRAWFAAVVEALVAGQSAWWDEFNDNTEIRLAELRRAIA